MTARAWGEEYRTTTVLVDSFEHGEVRGRIYNPYRNDGKSFESLMQMLITLEKGLDEMDFPRSFNAVRYFSKPPEIENKIQSHRRPGKLASFAVKILFRQNASWQGSVTWIEGKQEQGFRSALELIFLINGALSEGQEKKS
jgi:hypothetical protein